MSDLPHLDWEGLFWGTRGFTDLDDQESVPRHELQETALANVWSEREFETALRATDDVEAVGDPLASNPALQYFDADDSANEDVDEKATHIHELSPRAEAEFEVSRYATYDEVSQYEFERYIWIK